MNKLILETLDRELTVAVGRLALVLGADDKNDEDCKFLIKQTTAELIGLTQGIRIFLDNQPKTLGELEQAQFDRAEIIPEKDCSDVYPGLY